MRQLDSIIWTQKATNTTNQPFESINIELLATTEGMDDFCLGEALALV